jgi:tetratricopeptide (TPR) repeat protein
MSTMTDTGNAFQQTLTGVEFTVGPAQQADLFSRACIEQLDNLDSDHYTYLLAQVFEPNVLREVALLGDLDYPALASLENPQTPTVARLADSVTHLADLPVVAAINLAVALISVSRFDVAERVLTETRARTTDPRARFEIAMLAFIISNRRDDGAHSAEQFRRMRAEIETGALPGDRILDACTQAVVWYLKRHETDEADFHWYLATGRRLAATPDRLDPGSVSSWWRGVAMVPAAQGSASATRRCMQRARNAAVDTITRRPRAYEQHFLKTYHESTLKEHLFVTGDRDRAVAAGQALIDLDPVWSVSYGELAEAYLRFGDRRRAAELYETAARIGPPYLGHHLHRAGRCRAELGEDDVALAHYLNLLTIAPDDVPLLTAAAELADRVTPRQAADLRARLDRAASA